MKIIKHIIASGFIAIITVFFIYGSYTIYARDTYDFEEKGHFLAVKTSYHSGMNDLFNEKIEKLIEIFEKGRGLNDPNIYAPKCDVKDSSDCRNSCNEDNVSTYCVSVEALNRYLAYIIKLKQLENTVSWHSSDTNNLGKLFELTYERNAVMAEEEEKARIHMEGALNAYNELRMAYPMHVQYEKLSDSLIKYKNQLRSIYRQVKKYPVNFVDMTSTKCQ